MERVNRQELEHVSMATQVMSDVKVNQLKAKYVSVHKETALSGEFGQDTLPVAPPVVEVSNNVAEFVDMEIQVYAWGLN